MEIQPFTVVFLLDRKNSRVLLLKRAAWKEFAPNQFTGIGGKVDSGEENDIKSSLLRELEEETKITAADFANLTCNAELLVQRAGGEYSVIFYFVADAVDAEKISLECNEGDLGWYSYSEFANLDFIPSTGVLMEHLVKGERVMGVYDYTDGKYSLQIK